MNKRRILLLLPVLAIIIGAVWYATRPKPVPVIVAVAEQGDVQATVANTRAGTVEACQRARLAPAMAGQIAALPVREGDEVEAGQILLELWNEDLAAEVELARRSLTASRATAREICVAAQVAAREATRLTELHRQKLASEERADRARGDAEARAAGCEAAQDGIKVSAARLDVASAALERTILRAPFAGTVAEINGELGEIVTPSPVGVPTPPAVDLVDNSCLFIKAPIDEVDAPAIRTGMRTRVSLDAFPEQTFPGFVRRIAPYVLDIEKQARTVDIEAEIENAEATPLLPGYSADVEVILATEVDTVRVPAQAILAGDKILKYREADSLVEELAVEIGLRNWEYVQIIAGLEVGDRVILSVDREGVVDGALVKPE